VEDEQPRADLDNLRLIFNLGVHCTARISRSRNARPRTCRRDGAR
jgi:hypothetical protein